MREMWNVYMSTCVHLYFRVDDIDSIRVDDIRVDDDLLEALHVAKVVTCEYVCL